MRIEVDEDGYIYLLDIQTGKRMYILVDVPNCSHYGKLFLGEVEEQK